MRSLALTAAQRKYAASAKGRAAQARADAKHDERIRAAAWAEWGWRCRFHESEGRYPTREEIAARPK